MCICADPDLWGLRLLCAYQIVLDFDFDIFNTCNHLCLSFPRRRDHYFQDSVGELGEDLALLLIAPLLETYFLASFILFFGVAEFFSYVRRTNLGKFDVPGCLEL